MGVINMYEAKPNEIWMTKSGRKVLVVEGPNGEIGFVWFDEIDNKLTYCPLLNQLDKKLDDGIRDWAIGLETQINNAN